MRRSTAVAIVGVALAAAAIGAGTALHRGQDSGDEGRLGEGSSASVSAASARPSSALEELELRLDATPGSRRTVVAFELAQGRALRLHTVETARGETCLIDEEEGVGLGSTCLENGLFAKRPVAFSINSNGGPGRVRDLYLVGLAAPSVGSVVVRRTDGSSVELELGRRNAFLYQASAVDLEQELVPSAIEVYAHDGRLVEAIEIPGVR